MIFSINIPVKILSGRGCLAGNAKELLIGSKAYIVTGKAGAKSSGALTDTITILEENNIAYEIFSEVPANPPILETYAAAKKAFALEQISL